jgi:hypothetical protein
MGRAVVAIAETGLLLRLASPCACLCRLGPGARRGDLAPRLRAASARERGRRACDGGLHGRVDDERNPPRRARCTRPRTRVRQCFLRWQCSVAAVRGHRRGYGAVNDATTGVSGRARGRPARTRPFLRQNHVCRLQMCRSTGSGGEGCSRARNRRRARLRRGRSAQSHLSRAGSCGWLGLRRLRSRGRRPQYGRLGDRLDRRDFRIVPECREGELSRFTGPIRSRAADRAPR